MRFRLMLCLAGFALAASPVAAACLDATSIEKGVKFARADGRAGFAITKGRAIAADYARGDAQWTDTRLSGFGIYDSAGEIFRRPLAPGEVMVGGGVVSFEWKYSGVPPRPEAGKSWKTTIKETTREDTGLQSGPERHQRSYTATFRFVEPREVKLSGCTYAVLAVEGSFVASDISFTRRWVYFPDLGFGLETKSTDPRGYAEPGTKRGLAALGPAG